MTKYRSFERKPIERPHEIHPIWRGIGCIIMILIPIMAFLGTTLLIQQGIKEQWPMPADLMGHPKLPDWMYMLAVTRQFAEPVASVDNLYALIAGTVLISILAFGVLAVIYSWSYKAVGPRRYTPLDAPEVDREARRRRGPRTKQR
jgi:hypothetical protein